MLRDVSEAPSSQLKRKHEEYDSQEYLHPALLAPSYSLPGLNQSLAVKAPGERRMSLVRTSAAPIEARDGNADVHEAELEWVATDHLPHPSVLDKKWCVSKEGAFQPSLTTFSLGLALKLKMDDVWFVSSDSKRATNFECLVKLSLKMHITRRTSSSLAYIVQRLVIAGSHRSTSSICWKDSLEIHFRWRRRTEFAAT